MGVTPLHSNWNVQLGEGFLLTNPKTTEYLNTLYWVVVRAETITHLSILPSECPHNFVINSCSFFDSFGPVSLQLFCNERSNSISVPSGCINQYASGEKSYCYVSFSHILFWACLLRHFLIMDVRTVWSETFAGGGHFFDLLMRWNLLTASELQDSRALPCSQVWI